MKNQYGNLLALAMLLMSGSMAQAEDTFDPANPPEPSPSYQLTLSAAPEGSGTVSGKGRYRAGTRVWVNTSSTDEVDYAFTDWTADGDVVSRSRGFYYTMPAHDVALVANYRFVEFNPADPSEPNYTRKWRVNLRSVPEEACSFNYGSGTKFEEGSTVTFTAYANQCFEFEGWYLDDTKLGDSRSLQYTIPAFSPTLEARFVFNPDSPGEPAGGLQLDVDNIKTIAGDADGDGTVDIGDLQYVLKIMTGAFTPAEGSHFNGDADGDGTVDIGDVQYVLKIMTGSIKITQ